MHTPLLQAPRLRTPLLYTALLRTPVLQHPSLAYPSLAHHSLAQAKLGPGIGLVKEEGDGSGEGDAKELTVEEAERRVKERVGYVPLTASGMSLS